MNRKQQRITYGNNRKGKRIEKTTRRLFDTCFEDLPNEIFYEIWEYLDGCEIYDIFLNLNARFQYLVNHSLVPLKLHFSSMREDVLQYRIREILQPNLYRIISLRVSDSTIINRFITLFSIDSRFTKLERIALNGIKSDAFVSLLEKFISLPCLFYLSAHVIEKDQSNRHQISKLISCMPLLKYSKLSYESSPTTSRYTSSYWYKDLLRIHLFRKWGRLILRRNWGNEQPWDDLSSQDPDYEDCCTTLSVYRLDWKPFELFLQHGSNELEYYLDIRDLWVTSRDYSYLNANRWKQIIHLMPRLVEFHINAKTTKNQTVTCCRFIEGFQSPFWIEQGWIINHFHHKLSRGSRLIFNCIKHDLKTKC
ncbi:unnamed protein product [Rotaria socialis]|uniref:F-box domain-containing protein n=2 Tax=Rotaria socialis TaxID=392032 RepID=A0A820K0N7_9BILA|nr:unnamed protein product [Rotaria socialis]CAF3196310.1 unnamed protein product [Rotaria socialis]CAF3434085.1 unnamed protein product [Rotaria socialis]CAF3574249.1 unnamed protein product [Rotaria socialis]CAF4336095.1 unnamed protein product [Rotaria socialis]